MSFLTFPPPPLTLFPCHFPAERRGIAIVVPRFSADGVICRPFHGVSASSACLLPRPAFQWLPWASRAFRPIWGLALFFYPAIIISPINARFPTHTPPPQSRHLVSGRRASNWKAAKSRRMIVYQPVTCAAQWHGAPGMGGLHLMCALSNMHAVQVGCISQGREMGGAYEISGSGK